jgi:hypothetical protein
LAGERADGAVLLNGNDDPDRHLKAQGRRFARSFFGGGQGGVGDWPVRFFFKPYVKTRYAIGLNNTNGKPRCDAATRRAIGNGLWARTCLLAAVVDSTGVVKELHAKGEAAFVAEAGDKARVWWN